MKKTNRKPLMLLLTLLVALVSAVIVACGEVEIPPPKEGPETGVYYYDAGSDEYQVSLFGADRVSMVIKGVNKNGTYTVNGEDIVMTFGNEQVSAKWTGDVLTLTYGDGAPMRFIRKLYYTVSFVSNGGSILDDVTVLNGKTVAKPEDPVFAGHTFIGWYTDGGFNKPFLFGTQSVTSDVTLYAQWAEKTAGQSEYVLSFDLNYPAEVESDEPQIASMGTLGGKIFDAPVPELNGYVFNGWWISAYESVDKLTYRLERDTVLRESTTAFALWRKVESTNKLPVPAVSVSNTSVSWDRIDNARIMAVKVTHSDGTVIKEGNIAGESVPVDFASAKEGDYVIEVTAMAQSESNNSETAMRYYRNKSLDRVSKFSVVEPSVLLFNEVEGAEKYLISIDCGDKAHNHTDIDLGRSTNYNFANCPMQEGGIKFTVKAFADGHAYSVSRVFTYNRILSAVSELTVDEASQTVRWLSVPNAVNYIVSVKCGNTAHDHREVNVGNATSFDLKECDAIEGGIEINVYPVTKGYNSPAPTSVKYDKKTLAAPGGIYADGNVVRWRRVAGAVSYVVMIDNKEMHTDDDTPELELSAADLVGGKDYVVTVQAVSAEAGKSSLMSNPVTMRYDAMYEKLAYDRNTVSWRQALGAVAYEVRVNGGASTRVEGVNSARVALTLAGNNRVEVRAVYMNNIPSAWVGIDVYAYSMEFDTRGGMPAVETQYYAIGDEITMPDARPSKEGYDFDGWYTTAGGAASGGAKFDSETFNETGDIVLYANYKPATYYILDSESGEKVGESVYNSAYKWNVPENDDARYMFVGWFADRDGKGERYTDENGNGYNAWRFTYGVRPVAYWVPVFKFNYLEKSRTYSVVKDDDLNTSIVTKLTVPVEYDDGVHGKARVSVVDGLAFKNCTKLISISIPDTVVLIENTAFESCTKLEEVNIYHVDGNRDIRYESVDGILLILTENSSDKGIMYVPQSKTGSFEIPAGVTEIPYRAFNSSNISEVIIPSTVTNIRQAAFYSCKQLTTVSFRAGVGNKLIIDEKAFQSCAKLETISFCARLSNFNPAMFDGCAGVSRINMDETTGDYATVDGMLTNKSKDTILYCPVGRSGVLTIPRSITAIGESAFAKCVNLTEVVIPNWVKSIGESAFADCTGLTSVTVKGDDLYAAALTIGKTAFSGCNAITSLVMEHNSNVVGIGERAFYKNNVLTALDFPASLVRIDKEAFSSCNKLARITFAANSKLAVIGESAFVSCTALTGVELPASLTEVGDYAFSRCTKIQRVTFAADGAELSLGDYVFNSCTALDAIEIPANVIGLGSGVFYGCKALKNYSIDPENKHYMIHDDVIFDTDMTVMVFYPTWKTGAYQLPETVTKIGAGLFKGNTSINKITIGKNIVEIGANAFDGCSNLDSIEFESGSVEELKIGEYAFANCGKLISMDIPSRVRDIPQYMFYNCAMLNSVTVPDTVIGVGESAFKLCYALQRVTFGIRAEDGKTGVSNLSFIGKEAFSSCRTLDNVALPSSVTGIGAGAFYNCIALTTFSIADVDKVTEDNELTVANGTTTTGVFGGCIKLTNVTLPSRLTRIADYMFNNCSALRTITIPSGVGNDGNNVQGIGKFAFNGCGRLHTVTFASGGTKPLTVDASAFNNCYELATINFPSRLSDGLNGTGGTVNVFGSNAFANCYALADFNVDDGGENYASIDGILYSADKKTLIQCPVGKEGKIVIPNTVTTVKQGAFNKCESITEVEFATGGTEDLTVEDGTSAFNSVFGQCGAIHTVSFPARFVKLGDYTFANCFKLATVNFEKIDATAKLKTIGRNVFQNTALTSIVIPASVTSMGQSAFYDSELAEITIPGALVDNFSSIFSDVKFLGTVNITGDSETGPSLSGGAVLSNDKTKLLYYPLYNKAQTYRVPASVTTIAKGAFKNNRYLNKITFETGSKLKVVEDDAFYGCASLREITFPETLESIGANAFLDSFNLKTVDFGANEKVTTINTYTFSGCKSLKSITLPARVSSIATDAFNASGIETFVFPRDVEEVPNNMFYNCASLKSVTFNDKIKSVGNSSFYGCASLVSVVLPDTVKSIGTSTFKGCAKLATVVFGKSINTIGNNAFESSGVTSIVIPDSVTSLGTALFKNAVSLGSASIGTGVTAIPNDTFNGCTALAAVTIGANVSTIGNYAFQNAALTSVVIPDTVTSLGNYAFASCEQLASITFGTGLTTIGTYAFQYSALVSVTIPDGVTSLGNYAFKGCLQLTDFTFGAGLKAIPTGMFHSSGIKNLTIPEQIVTVNTYAFIGSLLENVTFEGSTALDIKGGAMATAPFAQLEHLRSVNFGDRSGAIGNYAFYGDAALEEVAFGNNSQIEKLGNNAFYGCASLTSFDFPETVAEIGDNAFRASGLTSVTLPEGISKFGNNIFYGCEGLIEVTIPTDSYSSFGNYVFSSCANLQTVNFIGNGTALTTIGTSAFYGAKSLTEITLPEGVRTIGNSAFNSTESLTAVNFPSTLEYIEPYAFSQTGLKRVELPTGLTRIGNSAFWCSSIEYIRIPVTVSNIGGNPFEGCDKLARIEFENGNSNYILEGNALYNLGKTALIGFLATATGDVELSESLDTVMTGAFAHSAITGITLPEGVTTIGSRTFDACTELTQVTLPSSITTIDDYAFRGCTSLETINIPRGVEYIGEGAFEGCTSLRSVVFEAGSFLAEVGEGAFKNSGIVSFDVPEGLTALSDYMFEDCSALTAINFAPEGNMLNFGEGFLRNCALQNLTIPKTVAKINYDTFIGANGLVKVVFDESDLPLSTWGASSSVNGEMGLFTNCTNLKEVDFGGRAVSLGTYAFLGCTSLTTITWEDIVNIDGGSVFRYCSSLVNVTLPDGLAKINDYAFDGCTSLQSITIPASVKEFNRNAFSNCTSLKTVIIEDGVLFGSNAVSHFENCTALTSVKLPSTVTSLPGSMFKGCTALENITIPRRFTTINSSAFEDCTNLKTVVFEEGSRMATISNKAFMNSGLVSIDIPGAVMSISSNCFENCTALTTVKLSQRINAINANAFAGCTNLSSINIPKKLMTLNAGAFAGCTSLTELTLPAIKTLQAGAFAGWTSTQTIRITGFTEASGNWVDGWDSECGANIVFDTFTDDTETEGGGTGEGGNEGGPSEGGGEEIVPPEENGNDTLKD